MPKLALLMHIIRQYRHRPTPLFIITAPTSWQRRETVLCVFKTRLKLMSDRQTNDKVGQFRLPIKSANKNLSPVMQKSAEFVCHQNRPILWSK